MKICRFSLFSSPQPNSPLPQNHCVHLLSIAFQVASLVSCMVLLLVLTSIGPLLESVPLVSFINFWRLIAPWRRMENYIPLICLSVSPLLRIHPLKWIHSFLDLTELKETVLGGFFGPKMPDCLKTKGYEVQSHTVSWWTASKSARLTVANKSGMNHFDGQNVLFLL